jgi:hypothetical protein
MLNDQPRLRPNEYIASEWNNATYAELPNGIHIHICSIDMESREFKSYINKYSMEGCKPLKVKRYKYE